MHKTYTINGMTCEHCVKAITEEYRSSEDILAEFIEVRCNVEPEGSVPLKQIFAAYKAFVEDDDRPLGKRQFAAAMEERGWPTRPGAKNIRHVYGIRLTGGAK